MMSDQDELQDRIAAAIESGLGDGLDCRGWSDNMKSAAQAIIDEFELTMETYREHKSGSAIELDETQAEYNDRVKTRKFQRVIGKWQKQ